MCPCAPQTQNFDPSRLRSYPAAEQKDWRTAFQAAPKITLSNFVRDQYLDQSVFINAQWLRAWFLGQPIDEMDAAGTVGGGIKASKAEAIDLIGDGGPDELEKAIELSKQSEAEKEAARKQEQEAVAAALRLSAAESPDAPMVDANVAAGADAAAAAGQSDMQGVVTESVVQRAASAASALDDAAAAVGAPPADDEPTASSSAAAAAAEATSASTVAAAAPPAARPPPPLRHPLWPGDLGEAQHSILCKHGRPDPRNADLKRIQVDAWMILAEDNAVQKAFLTKEREDNQMAPASVLAARSSSNGGADPLLVAAASAAVNPSVALVKCSDLCVQCCSELHSAEEEAEQDLALRNSLLSDILDSKVDSKNAAWQVETSGDKGMYLSKLFLSKWKTKAQQESIYEKCTQRSDSLNINEGIMCRHKALGVEEARHRTVVPKVRKTSDMHCAAVARACCAHFPLPLLICVVAALCVCCSGRVGGVSALLSEFDRLQQAGRRVRPVQTGVRSQRVDRRQMARGNGARQERFFLPHLQPSTDRRLPHELEGAHVRPIPAHRRRVGQADEGPSGGEGAGDTGAAVHAAAPVRPRQAALQPRADRPLPALRAALRSARHRSWQIGAR